MAICDGNYKFLWVDIGGYGAEGDSNVFAHSPLGKRILQNKLELPEDANVGNEKLPHYFLGDTAFPFTERIMKPYSHKQPSKVTEAEAVFNYRLSRARRCIENTFGILCSKWLCLQRTMYCSPDRAQKIVMACCVLHNLLLNKGKDTYCPSSNAYYYDTSGKLVEGQWRQRKFKVFTPLSNTVGRICDAPKKIRNYLKDYFNSPQGSLKWQKKSLFLV